MKLFFFFILAGCTLGSNSKNITRVNPGKSTFNLKDPSGNYLVEREVKRSGGKIVTRSVLKNWKDQTKPLEKSVTLYAVGKSRTARSSLLPMTSQFSVWFNKEKFFSQVKVDKLNKKISVMKKSPEKKWNGSESISAPKTRYICFFSSLPECLIEQNLLVKAKNGRVNLYIIWDNYPYYIEQYEGVSGQLLTSAQFSFSSIVKKTLRFELDLGNQVIFYHFDQNLEFAKMFWVAQGISLERRVTK